MQAEVCATCHHTFYSSDRTAALARIQYPSRPANSSRQQPASLMVFHVLNPLLFIYTHVMPKVIGPLYRTFGIPGIMALPWITLVRLRAHERPRSHQLRTLPRVQRRSEPQCVRYAGCGEGVLRHARGGTRIRPAGRARKEGQPAWRVSLGWRGAAFVVADSDARRGGPADHLDPWRQAKTGSGVSGCRLGCGAVEQVFI